MQCPANINPVQWSQAVGLARQAAARVYREGGSAREAAESFGVKINEGATSLLGPRHRDDGRASLRFGRDARLAPAGKAARARGECLVHGWCQDAQGRVGRKA